jgi:predicted nuclease of predicted toxin-antitoxin system
LRLLLDAHVSGRRIGVALRARGHDVLAVNEERGLDGRPDEELMELASVQRRILVTFDVADFRASVVNGWRLVSPTMAAPWW